jgi:hypothetical protein
MFLEGRQLSIKKGDGTRHHILDYKSIEQLDDGLLIFLFGIGHEAVFSEDFSFLVGGNPVLSGPSSMAHLKL